MAVNKGFNEELNILLKVRYIYYFKAFLPA